MPSLGGWEFVILIGILVLLFGAKRLPDMARSIGQSARVFKGEMKGMKGDDERPDKPADPPAAPAPPAVLPPAQPAASQEARPEPTRATQPGPSSTGQ
jgi:sec-independent protein translocase protein TatA